MTPQQCEAFEGMRKALMRIIEGTEWECGDDACPFCYGGRAAAMADKAVAEPQEPMVMLTLEQPRIIIRKSYHGSLCHSQTCNGEGCDRTIEEACDCGYLSAESILLAEISKTEYAASGVSHAK